MRLCLIYNYAQHYRTNIFTLLDQNLDIDFVFGDRYQNVKKMDYSLLSHKVTEVKNKHCGPIVWQRGVVKQLFGCYDKFIMLGEPMCLSTWVVLVLGRLMGKKVFFWTHGWYGKETLARAIIKKLFFSLSTGTMLYGNYARELMIKEGLNPKKLTTIHNSLMYDEQLPIRQKLRKSDLYSKHFGNDLATVVFIGRLTPVKKLGMLLKAQSINKEHGLLYNVAFIGDGEMLPSLKEESEALGLSENVWFYGPSYNEEELSQILYDADLCVAPGNIGLTAMHAMVYGCPCISHNDFKWQMPEFEAIKEGVTGSFFERDNVESLAECITNWFVIHRDDREIVRLACFKEIDEEWNPHVQLERIKNAIGE